MQAEARIRQARAAQRHRRQRPRAHGRRHGRHPAQPLSGPILRLAGWQHPGACLQHVRCRLRCRLGAGHLRRHPAQHRGRRCRSAGLRGIAPGRPGDVDGRGGAQLHRAARLSAADRHRAGEPRAAATHRPPDPPAVRRRVCGRPGCSQCQCPGGDHGLPDPPARGRGPPVHLCPQHSAGPGAGRPGSGAVPGIRHPGRTSRGTDRGALGFAAPAAGYPPGRSGHSCGDGADRGRHGRSVPQVFDHRFGGAALRRFQLMADAGPSASGRSVPRPTGGCSTRAARSPTSNCRRPCRSRRSSPTGRRCSPPCRRSKMP